MVYRALFCSPAEKMFKNIEWVASQMNVKLAEWMDDTLSQGGDAPARASEFFMLRRLLTSLRG